MNRSSLAIIELVDMFPRTGQNFATVCLAALLLAGCQPAAPTPPIQSGPTQLDFSDRNDAGSISGEPVSPDAILSTDPAASRLQDIGGFMLLYYRDNKKMPATLDELAKMPGGDSLDLTAPRSGRQFVYQPAGLWSDQHPDKCIIAYDPDVRNGVRWSLLMAPPVNGAPLVVTVIAIPEHDFLKYHEAAQQ